MTESIIYDYIIIGSGFGGSVAAHKLAHGGAKTLLLERGPWRDTDPVKKKGIANRSPLPAGKYFYRYLVRNFSAPFLPRSGIRLNPNGLFDIHYDRDMTLICTSGVGGGSHAYSAMNTLPQVEHYWQNILGEDGGNRMIEHYQWMMGVMGSRPVQASDQVPNFIGSQSLNSEHFVADESVDQPAMGVNHDPDLLPYENNSFFGSQTGAKTTLDVALIEPAIKKGLSVYAEHECMSIHREEQGYRIHAYDHRQGRYRFFKARQVILAAGTLNSLKILYRSRDMGGVTGMPALGANFAGNGDFPAWWRRDTQGQDMTKGTPCHGRFELKDYENCPTMTSYGLNGLNQIPMPEWMRKRLRPMSLLVSMGADEANGFISWRRGRLAVHYIRFMNPVLRRIAGAFREVAKRSNAPVVFSDRHLMTVHPLGGARCGADIETSVVNLQGEVHDNPGLYVVDASALPAAPGSPPSMTIAAWSAHVCDALLNSRKVLKRTRTKQQVSEKSSKIVQVTL